MIMGALITGIIFIALGVGLVFWRKKTQDKLLEIKATPLSTAKDLTDMCKTVNDELNPGSHGAFKQEAAVQGTVKCDRPLTAELSKEPCVYYDMRVEERYEETYWEKDAQGNSQSRTRTGTNTVASNSQRRDFRIEDATGRITVNPNNAHIDPVQVVSKYEQSFQDTISFGNFSFNVNPGSGDRRILGYEFTEKIIPVERRVYAIGEAADASGELMIQNPSEKGKPFIITLKSRDELAQDTASSIKWMMIGAIICFGIGIGAVAYGILTKLK
jgi:hypothetical protein